MRRKVHLAALIILLSPAALFAGCSPEGTVAPPPAATFVDVTVAEAETLILTNPELVVLDASPYYIEAHIPGAVPYPIVDGSLSAGLGQLDSGVPYLVYAHLGDTSMRAAEAMIASGFRHVYRLEGDFTAWISAGLPISVPTPP